MGGGDPSRRGAGSDAVGRRHPVEKRAHTALRDREPQGQGALLQRGVLEPASVDRLIAGVPVQPLDDVPRLVVDAPQIPRG